MRSKLCSSAFSSSVSILIDGAFTWLVGALSWLCGTVLVIEVDELISFLSFTVTAGAAALDVVSVEDLLPPAAVPTHVGWCWLRGTLEVASSLALVDNVVATAPAPADDCTIDLGLQLWEPHGLLTRGAGPTEALRRFWFWLLLVGAPGVVWTAVPAATHFCDPKPGITEGAGAAPALHDATYDASLETSGDNARLLQLGDALVLDEPMSAWLRAHEAGTEVGPSGESARQGSCMSASSDSSNQASSDFRSCFPIWRSKLFNKSGEASVLAVVAAGARLPAATPHVGVTSGRASGDDPWSSVPPAVEGAAVETSDHAPLFDAEASEGLPGPCCEEVPLAGGPILK